MNYHIELQVQLRNAVSADEFDEIFDGIADALYECSGVQDADLAGDYSEQFFTFTMNVLDVGDPVKAMEAALTVARTAVHATGGHTPDWLEKFEFIRQSVQNDKKSLVDA